ncbi:hypothetical protein HMPREF9018_0877 [Prevotella amnii CRIS 21A-A]|jgi:hypothetical protein|uniref:Lipoprotein n=1 Tax=Prevotella amnii CRIS 21A-A TaxID=679191 RepID=E1GYH5_9BACT|nr:DUF4840 domain-containing protein [Prevotella amnii]EFN90277.1 hypothetical protein HMPREF9018_0877 [Prevotella amnii CRIS 21A-A]
MKFNLRALVLSSLGVIVLFTVSSCLGDSDNKSNTDNEFLKKAVKSSLGSWNGTLKFANSLGVKEDVNNVSWIASQEKNNYYITIPKFPISKIANSIQMPKSASLVEKALYDSLSLVKNGISSLPDVSYKAIVGSVGVNDPAWSFIPIENIKFKLNYLKKDHYYMLMQTDGTENDKKIYAYKYSSCYITSPESMAINGVFQYLVETNEKGEVLKLVKEYSPSQFFYKSVSHKK